MDDQVERLQGQVVLGGAVHPAHPYRPGEVGEVAGRGRASPRSEPP